VHGCARLQQRGVHRRSVVRPVENGVLDDGSFPAGPAQDAHRLPAGGGDEPADQSRRVLNPVKVFEQAQPGRLHDVVGVRGVEPEGPRHRPQQPAVLLDQLVPRMLISLRRPGEQGRRSR
jgi:hypothetical protein